MEPRCKHSIYEPGLGTVRGAITLEGDEARHAVRVKRVTPGQRVALLDGAGRRVIAEVTEAGRRLVLEPLREERVERPTPRVELFSALPKGPRAGTLIDLISQAGADAWAPLETAFGVETMKEPRHERLARVAVEALKQCGRPWLLELGAATTLDDACSADDATELLIADACGDFYSAQSGMRTVRVLIGPEGGWRDDELAGAIGAGARPCRFGPHVMRIETAAAAATAIVRNANGYEPS